MTEAVCRAQVRRAQVRRAQVYRAQEVRSDAAQQDHDATELHEAEEVVGVVLVARDEAPKVRQPREESLHVPATAVATQGTPVLGLAFAVGVMRRDHLHAKLSQLGVEWIAVVGAISDETRGQRFHESGSEGVLDEPDLMALTTANPDGDRKAIAVCHCHDLGRLATSSSSNQSAPFFAPAWLPSM